MSSDLNLYGDHLSRTTGTHGADIASQRLDDLDRRCLVEMLQSAMQHPVCLDLGCGYGYQGMRMALMGGCSHLYDLLPLPSIVSCLKEMPGISVAYTSGDIGQLTANGSSPPDSRSNSPTRHGAPVRSGHAGRGFSRK